MSWKETRTLGNYFSISWTTIFAPVKSETKRTISLAPYFGQYLGIFRGTIQFKPVTSEVELTLVKLLILELGDSPSQLEGHIVGYFH